MKATGIVRRIDELGRVVIPKELRRTMRIREGEELEVTAMDDSLVLKKYSAVREAESLANYYVSAIFKSTGLTAIIVDKDRVVACEGNRTYRQGDPIGFKTEKAISDRKLSVMRGSEVYSVCNESVSDVRFQIVAPIMSYGDTHGAIILMSEKSDVTETAMKIAETAADFLGTQLG